MSTFINLRGYGEHTRNSLAVPSEALARAAEYGQDALALTDARTLAGVPAFAREAKAAGIKPIIGMEISLATSGDRLHVHRPTEGSPLFHEVTLLARTRRGWDNLVAINNATQDPAHSRPVADLALLARHSEGLILLTGGVDGPLAEPLARSEYELAERNLAALTSIFEPGSIFLEITCQKVPGEWRVAGELQRLSEQFAVPAVATSAFSYVDALSAPFHVAVAASAASPTKAWIEPARTPDLSLRSEEQMRAANRQSRFWQEAVGMTSQVAGTIEDDVLPEPVKPRMPRHRLPNGYRDPIALLRELAVAGLNQKDGCTSPQGMWRLDAELAQVAATGAAKYFLLLHGLVSHLRSRGIAVGPGRGGAGCSFLLYGLGVTDVDPLEAGLHFESFLMPEKGLPVFDLDLERSGADEAVSYLAGRYGKDRVARLSSTVRLSHRSAQRRAGQILAGRYHPAGSDAEAELAEALAGCIQSVTTHPTAVVISAAPLSKSLPLRAPRAYDDPSVPVLAWTRPDIEGSGLLVINLVGIHALTPMGSAMKAAEAAPRAGGQIGPVPRSSRMDLPSVRKAWWLLYEQDIPGFKMGARELKEMLFSGRTFDRTELANLIAVSPSGPNALRAYLASSATPISGTETALVILSRVTADSRGILLYREQIVEASVRAAGCTTAEGYRMWEALAAASPERTEAERERFIAAVEGHLPAEAYRPGEAEALFAVLAASAPGARSKAHSSGMAQKLYTQAWLMSAFPSEYGSTA